MIHLLMRRAMEWKMPLLEAGARRVNGLKQRDATELAAAIQIWESRGAIPNLGRARAELGVLAGDRREIEAGPQMLRSIGDADYVDRFSIGL